MSAAVPSLLVTGSSGFVGSHLMPKLASAGFDPASLDLNPPRTAQPLFHVSDIRESDAMAALASLTDTPDTVVHLAAIGEVLIPFSGTLELHKTNVIGTWNVLTAFDPSLLIFASSSSVYGDKWKAASVAWEEVCPVGSYGNSKVAGELLARDWAIERTNRTVVSLRLANIIGPGCRGMLRYIAEHALRFPDGEVPARLRGAGRLVRDYVPVQSVTDTIVRCCLHAWTPGTHVLNISSGLGLTNGEILEIALPEIERAGLKFRVEWSPDRGNGESRSVILDPRGTEDILGIPPPTREDVVDSVIASIRAAVTAGTQEKAKCAS